MRHLSASIDDIIFYYIFNLQIGSEKKSKFWKQQECVWPKPIRAKKTCYIYIHIYGKEEKCFLAIDQSIFFVKMQWLYYVIVTQTHICSFVRSFRFALWTISNFCGGFYWNHLTSSKHSFSFSLPKLEARNFIFDPFGVIPWRRDSGRLWVFQGTFGFVRHEKIFAWLGLAWHLEMNVRNDNPPWMDAAPGWF